MPDDAPDDAPRPLIERLTAAPLAFDAERGRAVADGLGDPFTGPARDLIEGTAGSSPFLARLIEREAAWLRDAATAPPETALEALIAEAGAAERRDLARGLRRMRARAALLIALADLGGVWDLATVTAALSRLARAAIDLALAPSIRAEIARGTLPGLAETDLPRSGFAVIGMGKLGAEELNYSSDIDLICLFDQDRFEPADYAEVRAAYLRVTREMVKLLSERTAEGYVFRVDLRLRPNPSTTPVCLAMEPAERYYEGHGRTWERAAHVKSAEVAGDLVAGRQFLDVLAPFVWRRSLDFYAIEEVQGLLEKIRAGAGESGPPDAASLPGTDIKRAPGGIREIEFFAQTRQLVLGGRDPRLRARGTVAALDALAAAGHVGTATARALAEDYAAHRTLEHRLQMIEDAQTHAMPEGESARERLARLAGRSDTAAFERETAERLARVHATVAGFFAPAGTSGARRTAPRTDAGTMAGLGFERPEAAARAIEGWRSGAIAATRSARARRLYAEIEPRLFDGIASAASPDDALVQVERFLGGLPAGVQVFSLFAANPRLLDLVVEIVAASPRLAHHLGRNPQALDALIVRDFFETLPDAVAQTAALDAVLAREADYERALDAARAWAREQTFRAGVQVLRALADDAEAGHGFSAIAEACLVTLLPRTVADFAARHGMPPGRGLAVLALGKLGTREMTAGSDLDLIVIYDAAGADASEGPKPLAPTAYYPRLVKAVVAALTAPTTEGRLYEVDMRLRPSGRSGPVAVSLDAFRGYHEAAAEVWEHLALSRARIVACAGPDGTGLAADAAATARAALDARRGARATAEAAMAMRARLIETHAAERRDPWALKHAAGGVMEIEFLAQTGALLSGAGLGQPARAALPALAEAGWLDAASAERLTAALRLQQRLQQVERAALDQATVPTRFGTGLRRAFARAADAPDFEALTARLGEAQREAADLVEARFAALDRENG